MNEGEIPMFTVLSTMLVLWLPSLVPEPLTQQWHGGWTVQKRTDPMTDETQMTAILPSVDGRFSLRLFCAEREAGPIAFITVPKGRLGNQPTLVEVRFDKGEPRAFLLSKITLSLVVKTFGGSTTADNYSIGDAEMWAAGQKGYSGPVTGRRVLNEVLASSAMVFRAGLVDPEKGVEGRFQLAGLRERAAAFLRACPDA